MKTNSLTKIVSAILVAALAAGGLAACNQSGQNVNESDYIISAFTNLTNGGELFIDNSSRLNFCDFTTMTTAIICPNPNCSHNNPDTCSSFGMEQNRLLYDGSLYYFTYDVITTEDGYEYETTIHKANTDGTNRSDLYTIKGLAVFNVRMLVRGSKLFFYAEDGGFDEYGTNSGSSTAYICSYDLATGKFTQSEALYSGYNGGCWIYGAQGDHLYINYSVSDVKIEYDDMEALTQMEYILVDYNMADGTFKPSDKPSPDFVGKGYYIYSDDSGTTVLDQNSSVIAKTSIKYPYCTLVNDRLFVVYEGKCFDIKSQKNYSLNVSDMQIEVIDFVDDKYILKQWTQEGYKYTAITEEELIGEEL
jgi:hypothetical protein